MRQAPLRLWRRQVSEHEGLVNLLGMDGVRLS